MKFGLQILEVLVVTLEWLATFMLAPLTLLVAGGFFAAARIMSQQMRKGSQSPATSWRMVQVGS